MHSQNQHYRLSARHSHQIQLILQKYKNQSFKLKGAEDDER